MFKDMGSTIDESWAAIPYEFMANQKALRLNAESAEHIYGVDSSPVALIKDANRNGVLKSSESDFVWVFTGEERRQSLLCIQRFQPGYADTEMASEQSDDWFW